MRRGEPRTLGLEPFAVAAVVASAWLCAHAQEAAGVGMRSGTLKKVKETGAITQWAQSAAR
jgi:hypothetical protein